MSADGTPPRHHLQPVPPDEPPNEPHQPATHADPAAERALIAAALDHPEPLTLRNLIAPNEFDRPEHATVWTAWLTLVDSSETRPDSVLLNSTLIKARDPHALHALAEILTTPATPALAEHYARVVRDHARLRVIRNTAARLNQIATRGTIDDVEKAVTDALETLEANWSNWGPTGTEAPHTWAAVDLGPALNGEEVDPPPTMLARNDDKHLLYQGAVHTISGEPGSGKTWVALLAALQELRAGHVVTMIDFEDRASRVIARLLGLGALPNEIRQNFRYVRPRAALDTNSRPDLHRAIDGSSLVILDGVTEAMTLHGYELEKNADVARFYDTLPRWIADTTGAGVAMIDHVVKDSEKQGRWALGGQHKLAGIDGVAYLVRAVEPFGRGKTGVARITVSKDRPGYVEEIAQGRTVAELVLDARDVNCLLHDLRPPGDTPTDDLGNMRPTVLMERVSRYLEANPGLSKTELLDGRIRGKGTYLKRAIDRLIQEGHIEVTVGPNRKQSHRSITPFREDDEETLL